MENNVKYLLLDQSISWKQLSQYLACVSEDRRLRLEKFVFEKDKITSVLAELLLRYEMMRVLHVDHGAIRPVYDPLGKPYLEGFPEAHFSISHTDGCVAFAGGNGSVGVDTQKIAPVDLAVAHRFFHPQEVAFIHESRDQQTAFYRIWTEKEAYLKMLGTGMRKPLQSFSVLDENLNACLVTKNLPNHMMSFCCEKGQAGENSICFQEIKISQLLEVFGADQIE